MTELSDAEVLAIKRFFLSAYFCAGEAFVAGGMFVWSIMRATGLVSVVEAIWAIVLFLLSIWGLSMIRKSADILSGLAVEVAVAAEREACAKIARSQAEVAAKNGWVEYQRAAHNIEVMIHDPRTRPEDYA